MTAVTHLLAGYRPLLAKELRAWWTQRAAPVTFIVVALLGTLGTMATRIDEAAGGTPPAVMLEPTANIIGAQFDQWVVMAAILSTIGLLVQERLTGTLAWTLSMPVARPAVLLAKWTAAVVVLDVFAILLPLAWMSVLATVVYGGVPDLAVVGRYAAALTAVPALFVALNLALATRLGSQAAIAAISIGVAMAPYVLGAISPAAAALWPSAIAIAATEVALGDAVPVSSIVSWLVVLLGLALAGARSLGREDL